jgi:protein-disulfide isomerase-like protein with CxxC motif
MKKEKKKKSKGTGDSRSPIRATLFIDPVCPWGYSAGPALRTIEWRYRDQIAWEMVLIGLSSPDGPPPPYTPAKLAELQVPIRSRFGMPFLLEPKARPFTSSRACEAIAAVREVQPGAEWKALRAIQLLYFNTPLLPDDDDQLRSALESVPGLDAEAAMAAIDSKAVQETYAADRARARSAAGGPAEAQGKTADSPEGPRYTAPSLILRSNLAKIEVGGFQPVEAYDLAVANLAPGLKRVAPPEDPVEALRMYRGGLTTQEVTAIMTKGFEDPSREEVEQALLALAGEGRVTRVALGSDALWIAASKG